MKLTYIMATISCNILKWTVVKAQWNKLTGFIVVLYLGSFLSIARVSSDYAQPIFSWEKSNDGCFHI